MLKKNSLTVFIIGLGQIGASLGYDLSANRAFAEVIGYDRNVIVSNYARRKGAVRKTVRSIEEGMVKSNIIILATPIRETIKLLPLICKLATPDKIIIDLAGTKSEIIHRLQALDCQAGYFSCHPMAGAEKQGISAARKGLFEKAIFVIVPLNHREDKSLRIITKLIRSIGAIPVVMTADRHDKAIALTSHLPYILALSLTELTAAQSRKMPEVWKLAGGSLKSAVRVAMSSPELTFDMLTTNRVLIAGAIDLMITRLRRIQKLINEKEHVKLKKVITEARYVADKVHNG